MERQRFPTSKGGLPNAVMYGAVNALVSIPALIAYTAIVFKDPLYAPYLGSLCRFLFFASAIHQLVFVCLSGLPCAIGQVQDVGLIFLSAMATDIALRLGGSGPADAVGPVALGSSLLIMSVSTALVGLLTMLVAHLKLADLVSYVPLPVVGGYLGFVGYYCIAGGTALAAGVQLDTLLSWVHLLAVDPLIKLIPAAATVAALMLTAEHVSHPLALPALLTAIPLAFHGVLWAAGWGLADAQAAGWVMPPTAGISHFWELWGLFNLQAGGLSSGVSLSAMVAQLPKLAGLFLVVCFGSCMDVAAIQSDMPTPLDFNRELMTVGVSNTLTGFIGAGYTGCYDFSQTVFTMRQGVFHRANGLTVALLELAVFALPFSVVQYLPNFYLGALLVWFGIDIARDWLIMSYRKLSRAEYVLLWLTFVAIMALGLELGIGSGIVMATLFFASQYARSQVSGLHQVAARSGRTHLFDTSSTLELLGRRMAVLRLSGYVFFGSSTGLGNQVLQLAACMLQEQAKEQKQHEAWALTAEREHDAACLPGGSSSASSSGKDAPAGGAAGTGLGVRGPSELQSLAAPAPPPSSSTSSAPADVAIDAHGCNSGHSGHHGQQMQQMPLGGGGGGEAAAGGGAGAGPGGGGGGGESGEALLSAAERHWCAAHALSQAPVAIILDFRFVSGLDSTAARTFSTLVTTLASQHVHVVFANIKHKAARQLLQANGLPLRPYVQPALQHAGSDHSRHLGGGGAGAGGGTVIGWGGGAVPDEEGGLGAGNRQFVESPLVRPEAGGCWEFANAPVAVHACEDGYLGLAMDVGLLASGPGQAVSLQQLLAKHLREVFPSVPSDLGGLVGALEGALSRKRLQQGELLYGVGAAVRAVYIIELGALVEEEHFEGGVRVSSKEHGPGVVVGALEYFLSKPAPASMRCASPACQLLVVGQAAFAQLMAQQPRALAALQSLLVRSAYLDLASAQDAAHHGGAL